MAFKHNVETEMKENPGNRAQNLAIAYSIKRRAQKHKMAEGGHVHGPECADGCMMAEGGAVDKFHRGAQEARKYSEQHEHEKGIHTARMPYPGHKESFGESMAGYSARDSLNEQAKNIHKEKLHEMRSIKKPNLLAEGGQIMDNEQDDAHELDMVDRIMKQRQMMSEGGKVANDTHPFDYEFEEPNQFDDLVKRDDLESSYTGANSGDMDGNEQVDQDEHDMVMRIMKSRAKKDRMPRPA